ncbi:MAG: S9 family peptidase [Lysobacter sp.]|nr:S9 family peptidase [Lysobacter sp.]
MKNAVSALLVAIAIAIAAPASFAQAPKPHEVEDFIRKPKFNDIKISPTGEYYAATVAVERKTILVVLRRSDNKPTAQVHIPGDRTHVAGFWWVSDKRIVVSAAEKIGEQEEPRLTGDLYAVNADGGKGELLVGQTLQVDTMGTNIRGKRQEDVAAFLLDDLPADDKNVLIKVIPFTADPYTRVERMDTFSGRRVAVTRAPVRNASFLTDNAGVVRFAWGQKTDLVVETYYRAGEGDEWKLVSTSDVDGLAEYPLGFAPDNKTVYMQVQHKEGPDSVVAWNIDANERKEVLRDDDTDPYPVAVNNVLHGVGLMDGLPRKVFFDEQSGIALLQRKLEKAFPGQAVTITSATSDGKLVMVKVWSDTNPGDLYVFDTVANKADYLDSLSNWIDPAALARVKPISFKARDGLDIHGYLTSPAGKEAQNAPLVVLVHGGPFGVSDVWGFDREAQLLAAHGYAVLQVNFRGSGNHGYAFLHAGRREWGGKMQDDITDATKWAIQQGIADPDRICIYGASYGGYASLMGVAKEPELYRCAAGYVGLYDLPTLHTDGDIRESRRGKNEITEWHGSREQLAAVSPNRLASRIKVPVFLAAGGQDRRTPMKHTEMMEKALRAANVPVEAIYYPTEGHGFYKTENEREYYGKLLAFFQRHLGGRAPVIVASGKK